MYLISALRKSREFDRSRRERLMAAQRLVGPCGHRHSLWSRAPGERTSEPLIWRVVEIVWAQPPTPENLLGENIRLAPGTRLRHDQSDYSFQSFDGQGIAELFVWDRFAVLDGPEAARCVAFYAFNPRSVDVRAIPAQLLPD